MFTPVKGETCPDARVHEDTPRVHQDTPRVHQDTPRARADIFLVLYGRGLFLVELQTNNYFERSPEPSLLSQGQSSPHFSPYNPIFN